jgi:prepilin-type N-terminal cleavage/methylation domain-containing protein
MSTTDVPRPRLLTAAGFTLLEVLVVAAIAGVMMAAAVPMVRTAVERMTFNSTVRMVGAEVKATRYAAVAKNRSMQLRFDCPAVGAYRMVEFTGNAAIDAAADRCSATAYPYPDINQGVAPDADGPIRFLPAGISFNNPITLTFDASGRASAATTVQLVSARQQQSITVAISGRVVE